MVDDVNLAAPAGVVAADEISSVLYQKIKIGWGADGTWNETTTATGKPVPIQLRGSDGTDRSNLLPVSVSSIAAGTNNIGDVDVLTLPIAYNAGTASSTTQRVVIASDQMGSLGQAATTASVPTVPASGTIAGDALPANFVSGAITTAMTGTTSTSLVAAPGASLRNYITTIIVSNAHATVGTDVVIQDGSGGTALLTIPAAAVYGGAVITLPIPLRQPTTNTALYCANITTGASTKVSAVGYKAA